jgi:hypothetical protein
MKPSAAGPAPSGEERRQQRDDHPLDVGEERDDAERDDGTGARPRSLNTARRQRRCVTECA